MFSYFYTEIGSRAQIGEKRVKTKKIDTKEDCSRLSQDQYIQT